MTLYNCNDGLVEVHDETLASGGRGSVHEVGALIGDTGLDESLSLVAKVFQPRYRDAVRQGKVERLIELGRDCTVNAAWPLANLFDGDEWVGYVMRCLDGPKLDQVIFDESVGIEERVGLSIQACNIVGGLRRHDIVIGDLSPANMVCVQRDGHAGNAGRRGFDLFLIDLDSVQVVDQDAKLVYPTAESREKSPEMVGKRLGKVFLTSRSDDFLLAVLVFRLLFGEHPLDTLETDRHPSMVRADNARDRVFAYAQRDDAAPTDAFGDALADLFKSSFEGPYESIPTWRQYLVALGSASMPQMSGAFGTYAKGPAWWEIDSLNSGNGQTAYERLYGLGRDLGWAAGWLQVGAQEASSKAKHSLAGAKESAKERVERASAAADVRMGGGMKTLKRLVMATFLATALVLAPGALESVEAGATEAYNAVSGWMSDAAAWIDGIPERTSSSVDGWIEETSDGIANHFDTWVEDTGISIGDLLGAGSEA